MQMADKIWVSYAPQESQLVRGFWAALRDEELPTSSEFQAREETWKQNDEGLALPAERFPGRFFHINPWKFKETIQPYMHAGYQFVRADAAEILQQYDLGQGALYPCAFYEHDKTRLVTDQVFCLNYGTAKDTVVLEKSKVRRFFDGSPYYFAPDAPLKGDEIVVRRSVLEGPDLWADPRINRSFFLSDRLAQALQAAKMKRAFRIYPCTVDSE
jgi:hypothetical protein